MTYVFLNPVVDCLYEKEKIEKLLQKHSFKRVYPHVNWIEWVCKAYEERLREEDLSLHKQRILLDTRCPRVSQLLLSGLDSIEKKKMERELASLKALEIKAADIEPIFIHCARELAFRDDLMGEEKLMLTPCSALAKLGEDLKLPKTRFLTWKIFLEELGELEFLKEEKRGAKTPLPLGYFSRLHIPVLSLSGKFQLLKFKAHLDSFKAEGDLCNTQSYMPSIDLSQYDLIEALYCSGGCHNGDGFYYGDYQ